MTEYIDEIQLGIIFGEENINTEKLADNLNQDLKHIFDGMPSKMTSGGANEIIIGSGTPPEYQLSSKDDRVVCNISQDRLDLFLRPESGDTYNSVKSEHQELLDEYLNAVFNLDIPGIKRIGFVYNSLIEVEHPTRVIESNFLKGSLGEIMNARIKINQRDTLEDVVLNNITQAGEGIKEEQEVKGVKLQRDINVRPEEFEGELSRQFADEMVEYCWEELDGDVIRGS